MATARKRNRRSISEFPDSILSHILSFLDTRDAVRSSVLSTRWKHLYASVPNLYVCDDFVCRSNHKNSFINFVDKVLFVHHLEPLERFHLVCKREETSFTSSQVSRWICSALRCEVEQLILGSAKKGLISLPEVNLFRCESLVSLHLNDKIKLNNSNDVWLPRLTSLCLRRIKIKNYGSFERLIRCCPILEDLIMEECYLKWPTLLKISSPPLKKLTIKEMRNDISSSVRARRIVIKAPSLLCLSITRTDDTAPIYSLYNVESLKEAHLDIVAVPNEGANALAENMEEIKHVQSLHLFGSTIKALSNLSRAELPDFEDLRLLSLQVGYGSCCHFILHLLMNAPLLESIIFEGSMFRWHPRADVPSCLQNTIKDIIFRPIAEEDNELKMVEYFLGTAESLEKLVIHSPDVEKQLMIAKKLLSFPRSSKHCMVLLRD